MPNKRRLKNNSPFSPIRQQGGRMDFKEQYFDVWQEAWKFHKRYSDVTGTDVFWERLIDEAGEIAKKNKFKSEYTFLKDLILAVISEIERVDKQQQRQEDKENEEK